MSERTAKRMTAINFRIFRSDFRAILCIVLIVYRGVSTYDYIIDQRAREQEESANPPARCSCCGRQRVRGGFAV